MDFNNFVPDIVTLCVAILGFAWTWGKIESRIEQLEEERTDTQNVARVTAERLNTLTITLENMRVALVGIDGTNGLRGELRETKDDVKNLISHLITPKTKD